VSVVLPVRVVARAWARTVVAAREVHHGQAEAEVREAVTGDGEARRRREVDRARRDGADAGDHPRVGNGERDAADERVRHGPVLDVDLGLHAARRQAGQIRCEGGGRGGEGHGERGAARQGGGAGLGEDGGAAREVHHGQAEAEVREAVTGDGEAGRRRRRSIVLGVMVPTPGTTRVSLTVRLTLPIRL